MPQLPPGIFHDEDTLELTAEEAEELQRELEKVESDPAPLTERSRE